jgi:beta-glucosidase
MKTKIVKILALIFSSVLIMSFFPDGVTTKKPIYLNTAYSFKERAADLVSRMTPEEKQSQLGNTMPPIPRLNVNKYDVWGEALHGVMGRNNNSGKTATSFPNSVAVGSTWDPDLIMRETSVIADEARGFNHDLLFTLTYWSPVVEPTRDPRWGRTAETFGEDPFQVSQIGGGFIRGLMGDDPTYLKAVPCGKHFFANNTEFNRHSGSADMDDRDMREYYLLPYRSLIENDDLPAIMTAYGAVNGVPVSASRFLVDTIAKRTYGLDGYVTGDCGAISDIRSGHRYVQSNEEAAALGLKSGVDTDCGSIYQTSTISALEKGLITEADIDRALVNIFTIRMRLGEFDPREKVPYTGIKPGIINDPSHNDLAVEIATKTPVLLKNEIASKTGKKALPLNITGIKKIAVLGPQADKVELGDYSGEVEPELRITPLAGIKTYLKNNGLDLEVVHSSGGNTGRRTDFFTLNSFTTISKNGTAKDYDATKFNASASGIITSARMGSSSLRGIKDGDWTAYDNIDLTNLDSIKFRISVAAGGTLEARVGSATGNIIASQKIEAPQQQAAGGFRFGGRPTTISTKINTLGITGPQTVVFVYREPEVPATDKETLDLAASADVALIFVGTDQTTGREESDRFSLTLPGNQAELIKAVADVNPNTIVVIQGMGMVEVEDFKNNPNIPGMIWTGYNGQAQGTAIAKILFGEVNPGGKLSISWYKSVRDLPEFNDYMLRDGKGRSGRTYWYYDKDVSYEFGYGLSYTTFEYSNFDISKKSITPNEKVTVTFDIKNTGNADGDEIAQVYVKTPDTQESLQRPIKRLKGFKRVTIPAGQTKTVSIDIDCSDLWFWDSENEKITFDKGRYIFEIGASSKNIKGQVEANMNGDYTAKLKTVVIDCNNIVFRPGSTGQTSITASLSDDSFLDINKAEIIYKSNNPSVASVDEKGQVKAIRPGIASVFAYVTFKGTTVSNSCPVKVMPDLTPAEITVGGKKIIGFNKDIKAYSYLLKENSKIPVVKATASNKDIEVNITQARQVPGTAVVVFVDNNTFEKNTYCINFDNNSISDEFNGGSAGNKWGWIRENKANHSYSAKPGFLTITSEPGDVSEGSNNARNVLLQSANTDWTIETKMAGSRAPSQPENAGIIAYENDDNFVKLMFRAVIKTTRQTGTQPGTVDFLIEENGIAKSVASFNLRSEIVGDNTLSLKLEKKGNKYTAYYATGGEEYKTLGIGDALLKDIRAGLIACDGIITQSMTSTYYFNSDTTKPPVPFIVSFDYFRITSSGVK